MIKQDYDSSTQETLVFDVHCDRCTHSKTYRVESWNVLVAFMARDDWLNYKDADEWNHHCSECKKETLS